MLDHTALILLVAVFLIGTVIVARSAPAPRYSA